MKKILTFISLSLMLTSLSNFTKLWSIENLPIYTGSLNQDGIRIVSEDPEHLIIVVDGKEYIVKKAQ
ncbi:MAG TPA: hypothetical protein PLE74_08305 [Candidatus Cloacimonadota bacterium]|nr:hypothetical protein [Candidatus Cloacimonadota bacterium]